MILATIQRLLTGAASNLLFNEVDMQARIKVLENAGYQEEADQYRAHLGTSRTIAGIMGFGFGAWAHFSARPSEVDAALTLNEARRIDDSAPGLPTDAAAANAHYSALRDSLTALENGEEVTARVDSSRFIPDPVREAADADLLVMAGNRLTREDRQRLEYEKADLEFKLKQFDEQANASGYTKQDFIEQARSENPKAPARKIAKIAEQLAADAKVNDRSDRQSMLERVNRQLENDAQAREMFGEIDRRAQRAPRNDSQKGESVSQKGESVSQDNEIDPYLRARQEAADTHGELIYQDVVRRLENAGVHDTEQRSAFGRLMQQVMLTQSRNAGLSPHEFYRKFGADITAKTMPERRFNQPENTVLEIPADALAPLDTDIKQLRKAAEAFYLSELSEKSVQNVDLGEVKFSKRGLKKAISSSANPLKLRLFTVIKAVLEHGELKRSADNTHLEQHPNIKRYHWVQAEVKIGDELVTVEVNVEEHTDGKLYYNHTLPGREFFQGGVQDRNPSIPGVATDAERQRVIVEHPSEDIGPDPSQATIAKDGDNVNLRIVEQKNKGSYTPDSRTISLFQSANASTFLHESGHYFLDLYGRMIDAGVAPEGVLKDMQTLMDWFGVKSVDDWRRMSLDEQRPYHEQFAKGFETYLAEGKAPNDSLRGIFEQLKTWLKQVYTDIQGALGVHLTEDVKGVMARIIDNQEPRRELTTEDAPDLAAVRQLLDTRGDDSFTYRDEDGNETTATLRELLDEIDQDVKDSNNYDSALQAAITCFMRFGDNP